MSDYWPQQQLNEAHRLLDELGVPDRETRPDYNRGKMLVENAEFSLGIPDRIKWLRANWQPKIAKQE